MITQASTTQSRSSASTKRMDEWILCSPLPPPLPTAIFLNCHVLATLPGKPRTQWHSDLPVNIFLTCSVIQSVYATFQDWCICSSWKTGPPPGSPFLIMKVSIYVEPQRSDRKSVWIRILILFALVVWSPGPLWNQK